MTIEDPSMMAARIWRAFHDDPVQEVFDALALSILSAQQSRKESAVLELIAFARIGPRLWGDPLFLSSRVREIYACSFKNDEVTTDIVRNSLSDFPPTYKPENDELLSAQTLISLPLGTQKARARLKRGRDTERLLHSQESSVVEILCQNPSIPKRDILFMAAKRPTTNASLEGILKSHRIANPDLRFALAANPYLSISHAMRISLSLPKQLLMDLCDCSEIHQRFRDHVCALLSLNNRETTSKSKEEYLS